MSILKVDFFSPATCYGAKWLFAQIVTKPHPSLKDEFTFPYLWDVVGHQIILKRAQDQKEPARIYIEGAEIEETEAQQYDELEYRINFLEAVKARREETIQNNSLLLLKLVVQPDKNRQKTQVVEFTIRPLPTLAEEIQRLQFELARLEAEDTPDSHKIEGIQSVLTCRLDEQHHD